MFHENRLNARGVAGLQVLRAAKEMAAISWMGNSDVCAPQDHHET